MQFGFLYGGTDQEVLADKGAALNAGQVQIMTIIPQITGNLGACLQVMTKLLRVARTVILRT